MITEEIGSNAGKIWNLLNEQGNQDPQFYLAVGWLAREGKIFDLKLNQIIC
jgi:hypothetical protein